GGGYDASVILAEIGSTYPGRRLPSEAQLLSIEQTGRLPRAPGHYKTKKDLAEEAAVEARRRRQETEEAESEAAAELVRGDELLIDRAKALLAKSQSFITRERSGDLESHDIHKDLCALHSRCAGIQSAAGFIVTTELFDAKRDLLAACTRYDWTDPIQKAQAEERGRVNFVNATNADDAPLSLLRFGSRAVKRKRSSPETVKGGKLGAYNCTRNQGSSVNAKVNTCVRAINEYVRRNDAALPAGSRSTAPPPSAPPPSTPTPAVARADDHIATLVSQLSRAFIARRELTPEAFDTSQAAGLAIFSVPIQQGGKLRGLTCDDNPGHFHKELVKLFAAANDITTWVDEDDRYMAYTYLDDGGEDSGHEM
ncbi:hypothetical protein B484DRAFT_439966, partial [Ochromonadaceae sp. CCMP2298]